MYRSMFVAALLCILNYAEAHASAVSIIDESVQVVAANGVNFGPGDRVVIRARANVYEYGADRKGYLAVALYDDTGKLVPNSIMAVYLGRDDDSGSPLNMWISFSAPLRPGRYRLKQSIAGTFSDNFMLDLSKPWTQPTPGVAFRTSPENEVLLRATLAPMFLRAIADVVVVPRTSTTSALATPPLYLRVDGEMPLPALITGGVRSKSLNIGWYIGSEYKEQGGKFIFRHKLYPVDDDWTAWSPETSVDYTFLQKGYHDLKVQARHVTANGKTIDSKIAQIGFELNEPLIAPGVKGGGQPGAELTRIDFASLYPKSRALLIGLWDFDDKTSFPRFDETKIRSDISTMETALKANGFLDISKVVQARITRDEMATTLADFIERTTEGDRIVIYFSTHGFADPKDASEGYLATSNCEQASPTARCLSLKDLKHLAGLALYQQKVKQVLVAVDSCFSGLGVMPKASTDKAPDLSRLGAESGAYMLTAGMSDQQAQIDSRFGGSTFTHFLSKGLQGDADIMSGGVITLSELLLYVQFEVAKATQSQQIPMLGRIAGGGEMLFAPSH